jgi:hypothetical protein
MIEAATFASKSLLRIAPRSLTLNVDRVALDQHRGPTWSHALLRSRNNTRHMRPAYRRMIYDSKVGALRSLVSCKLGTGNVRLRSTRVRILATFRRTWLHLHEELADLPREADFCLCRRYGK